MSSGFNFGNAGKTTGAASSPLGSTAPASGGLFGSAQPAPSSLGGGFSFGQAAAASSTPATGSSLFGGGSAAPGTSAFGGNTSTSSPLGGGASTGASAFGGGSSAAPSFGSGNATATPASSSGGSLFGTLGATASTQAKPSLFGGNSTKGTGWTFGQKQDENTPASTTKPAVPSFGTSTGSAPASNLFGGGGAIQPAPAGGGMFGNTSSAPSGGMFSNTAPSGSTTPAAAKPATSFSFASTTPAQTPPSSGAATGSLFGGTPAKPASLFGSTTPAAPAPSSQPAATKLSLFGGGSQPAQTPGLFGGQKASTPGSGGLFGNAGQTPSTTQTSQSTTPATTTSNLFGAPKPADPAAPKNLFGAIGGTSTPSSNPAGPGFSLTSPAGTTKPASSTTPAAAPSLFGSGVKNTTEPASTPPSLFGPKPATSTAPGFSLGGMSASPGQAPVAGAGNGAGNGAGAGATPGGAQSGTGATTLGTVLRAGTSTLGASTSGPAPDARSRLKNKSMDEILTRWAADLSKHQKEFQKQATQVQKWDTMLVQNTDKISKLYSKAFQAERDAAEVEKQISAVEGEQEELEQWLNKYEGEVEALLQKVGANDRNGTEGVDAERERTYKMAERLTDRIEGLNNDLKDVIEEVNGVSVTLGGANGSGGDDQVRLYPALLLWCILANT